MLKNRKCPETATVQGKQKILSPQAATSYAGYGQPATGYVDNSYAQTGYTQTGYAQDGTYNTGVYSYDYSDFYGLEKEDTAEEKEDEAEEKTAAILFPSALLGLSWIFVFILAVGREKNCTLRYSDIMRGDKLVKS